MSDFQTYLASQEESRRWSAECENASARRDLAKIRERSAMLISQHEPIASMSIDREQLRLTLAFLHHGDVKRLERELEVLKTSRGATP